MSLTFTGQTFLVSHNMMLHLMKRPTAWRLCDKEYDALMDFLDSIDGMSDGGGRWVDTTPVDHDGYVGRCAVTGRQSDTLQRVALISWTEQQDDADELRALYAEKKREQAAELWAEMTADVRAHEACE